MSNSTHPVDEVLPAPRLAALGIQHVLVMYAGAIAVPLIIGRALKLDPEQVAFLISADLFVCGLVTIIQSFGATQWFGIKLPVMMGVTFAAVGPMVAMANANQGPDGARMIFGAIIGAGIVAFLIAPLVSRMLRFFPPVVTGTIIVVIGASLMRIGINWIFGNPVGPTAPRLVAPEHAEWLKTVTEMAAATGSTIPPIPAKLALAATAPNAAYAPLVNVGISAVVLLSILVIAKFGKGFVANIAVLLGILIGGVLTASLGMMHFDKVASAEWFELITPLRFGMPIFDPILIITMVLVMIVVMIESTGMFLALGDMTGRKVTQPMLSAGLRTDGLGTIIGGLFNTFPYTSFSQNVGLVGVTGVKSRFVCVAGGVILLILGLVPKMGALVEALPTVVLGGAGLVMFGMVAATGIRILSNVDFKTNRNNLFVVAVSIGFGMIPLVAPDFKMWMPHDIHPLIESGILLASVSAVVLNAFFNGTKVNEAEIREAAMASEA
ncbi:MULTISPECIES: nucleobase:cation symporter-2 family protein [Aminobacter]|jgi:NCS2 family nucleobase:cation symporter-2|uniref:NCS2 family nucleobase:cation symporter-2 n=2 Tax=Aminobacter TaxID=31988 RepID=A0AAC9ARL6_AMIAI|nr:MULTISPECIES: nucleobase:cation symporter-2 family protein [Aminobacter]AMS42254.1 permease [Aminobacter aminovorans]MBA8906551.1 NCS2 family nucleobase:cation symporter-2 [Aminobacter ciceronei]MBA9020323.1 NCS2 family nucleobase:cation symporter-2 [Aminobacter ciceronei]MBB3710403.1 NCS2 family nucleobase:cation symporter-2 [Aminobacter aminovorans]